MKLALAQMLVSPGRPDENISRAVSHIAGAAAAGAPIVLLPETLECGWTHPSAVEMAGPIPGGTAYDALRGAAVRHGVTVCAGLVERSGDRLFNAAVLISPDGNLLSITGRSTNSILRAVSMPAATVSAWRRRPMAASDS